MPSRGSDLPCGIRWLLSGGIYADSERGWVGNSILYLASEEGCLPLGLPRSAMRTREVMWNFVIVGITSRHIFCIFWSEVQLPVLELVAIFLCLNSGMFLCVVHELCEVGRCRTSFQGAQDHCVKESVNILINILINICKY